MMNGSKSTICTIAAIVGLAGNPIFAGDQSKISSQAESQVEYQDSGAAETAKKAGVSIDYVLSLQKFKDKKGNVIFSNPDDIHNAYVVGVDSAFLKVLSGGGRDKKYRELVPDSCMIRRIHDDKSSSLPNPAGIVYVKLYYSYVFDKFTHSEIRSMIDSLRIGKEHEYLFSKKNWNDVFSSYK